MTSTEKTFSADVTKLIIYCLGILLFVISFIVESKPKTKISYGYSLDGFARIQVKNETTENLACWIAIDGYKKKFRLPAMSTSQWITTNNKRYTYASFSTWCDYIDLHPEYKNYDRG